MIISGSEAKKLENSHSIEPASNIKNISKNAFKIKLGKGVKLTPSIKDNLVQKIGCRFSSHHGGYVCPIEKKKEVVGLFEKNDLKPHLEDVFEVFSKKPIKVQKMENRLEILEKELQKENEALFCEIRKYNPDLLMSDFADPPLKEGRSESQFELETNYHQRYLSIKEKEDEVKNLRISIELAEKDEDPNEVLTFLSDNEYGDAKLFVELFKEKYLFDPTEGKEGCFYVWNGNSWSLDIHKERYKDFEEVAKTYETSLKTIQFEESVKENLQKRISQLKTSKRRKAVLDTVSSYLSFKGQWDYLPSKLPCKNGVIDLKTGRLEDYSINPFVKKICPIDFDPEAKCPEFSKFLKDITLGDEELERFLARLFGYSLLGQPREEKIFYLYGEGRNGKGTLMNAIQHVLGPLAKTFPSEMLLTQRNPPSSSSPNPELANLEGVRVAVFSEINEGRQVDSAKIKNLSGGDRISCRRLFSNHDLQIIPTHTLILQTNYKPKASSDDKGLWHRNILVPFRASFVKNPKEGTHEKPLNEKLKEEILKESPGILRWLVQGCLEYQEIGLAIPESILKATESYRQENDGIGRFIDEKCNLDSSFSYGAKQLDEAIKKYYEEEKLPKPKRTEINAYLSKRGFTQFETNKGTFWRGITIKPERKEG